MEKGSDVMSRAAGEARGAARALAGYPGIFHHLAAEHGEVAAIMRRISSGDGKSRAEHFGELRRNLLAHARAEEQEFYPRLAEQPELEELVATCKSEHQEVEGYLEHLEAMDPATAEWKSLFERLRQAVEQHVEREENELFPKAADLLERDAAQRMLDRYESFEEREKSIL